VLFVAVVVGLVAVGVVVGVVAVVVVVVVVVAVVVVVRNGSKSKAGWLKRSAPSSLKSHKVAQEALLLSLVPKRLHYAV